MKTNNFSNFSWEPCEIIHNTAYTYTNKCIIGIPVYKSKLKETEKASLNQLCKIIGHSYEICLICPKNIELNEYVNIAYSNDVYLSFLFCSNDYFKSTETYSYMLETPDFYKCFSAYNYLMIYQLDGWIFTNFLDYYINLNVDYIGSPWKAYILNLDEDTVGNGGVSLRKVQKFINVCQSLTPKDYECQHVENEDLFFCKTLRNKIHLKFADIKNASNFSLQSEWHYFIEKYNDKHLPMCMHAWDKYYNVLNKYIKIEYNENKHISDNKISYKDLNNFKNLLKLNIVIKKEQKENKEIKQTEQKKDNTQTKTMTTGKYNWNAYIEKYYCIKDTQQKHIQKNNKVIQTKKDSIIVSFTTWKKRDKYAVKMLEKFQNQTVKPDKIILWLSKDEYNNKIPKHLQLCLDSGLLTDIKFVDGNTKCYKRWEVFKEYDNAYIILLDDDFYYPEDYIEKLYNAAKQYKCPCCYFEKTMDYINTKRVEIAYNSNSIKNYLYPGFCCIPPGIIKKDNELFSNKYIQLRDKYNPISDDLWFSLWFKKNKIKIHGIHHWLSSEVSKYQIDQTQDDGLWAQTNSKEINGVATVVRNFATLVDALGEKDLIHKLYPNFNIEKCSNKLEIDKCDKDTVSIIMTAYNAKKYIKDAIDSIYNQTYFKINNNWELLIGVDGCNDTLNYLKSIMKNYDNHLRIFMMDSNKGTYVTSNTLLTISKYNWVMRFDSDDILKSDAIEKLIIRSKGYDCCIYKYDIFNDNDGITKNKISSSFANGTIFVKSDVIKYLGGYEPWPVAADAELIICRIKKFFKVNEINEPLFNYRVHNLSLSHNKFTNANTEIRKKYNNIWQNKNLTNINEAIIKCETNTYYEINRNDINI